MTERVLALRQITVKASTVSPPNGMANACAVFASVIDTAELAGAQAFNAIQALFVSPPLPIPTGGE